MRDIELLRVFLCCKAFDIVFRDFDIGPFMLEVVLSYFSCRLIEERFSGKHSSAHYWLVLLYFCMWFFKF